MRDRFVCARITRMNGVDLNRFEFDYDTTWNAFFVDADLNVYSRYGGRDESNPEARLSKASLIQTMEEVLAVHHRRPESAVEQTGPVFHPVPAEPTRPEDIPLLQQNHQGCVHCHQIQEYRILQWSHDGEFDRSKLFPWPLPENVGLSFDRDHGHRISAVQPGSAAARAGLHPQDTVIQIDDVPVRSEYDFRWGLHRAADNAFEMTVMRPDDGGSERRLTTTLRPTGDWRQTDIGWRKSLRSVPFPLGLRGYDLTRSQRREVNLPEEGLALKLISIRDGLGTMLECEKQDVVIAIDGDRRQRTFEQFQSDLLRQYEPGDEVHLTVLRQGQTVELRGPFPEWFTEETSVP